MMIKGAQSVYRTLNILKLIAGRGRRKVSVKEISVELDIPPSTVHRLISVLRECGFISFDPSERKYYIGKECIVTANSNRDDYIRARYSRLARHIAEQFGHTTALYARRGYDCVCVERVEGTRSIQVFTCRPGDIRPLGLGSATLAMLAFLEDGEVDEILAHNAPRLREMSLGSEAEIRRFIGNSRERGYGYAHGLAIENTVGISFPLRREDEIVGAIAVDSLKNREWDAELETMVDYIRANME